MSFFVEQIANFGIPEITIALILMLPVVATFTTFCRQIIGIRGFGIYITLIIAFTFLETELKYGLVIFFVVILAGTLTRLMMKKIRIAYLPRMALVLTSVVLAIFLMFLAGSYLEIVGLLSLSIFPILIMTLVVERFVSAQIEKGDKTAVIMTLETLILAVISYYIINWLWLQQILLHWPILSLFLLFLINLVLGRWTGLRITEYLRFRELMKYLEVPQKKKKK